MGDNTIFDAILYAGLTSRRYPCKAITVKDGVATDHMKREPIPVEHLAYRRVPSDGIYTASEATCGGKCSIGKPKKSCIGKCYSPDKCSVYFLKEYTGEETVMVKMKDLLEVIDGR